MPTVKFLQRSPFCTGACIDTLTHLVVGGCIGELAAGRVLGRRALLLGGGAQLLPDLDVVAALWLPPDANLLVHRGPTHSLLLAGLLTWLLPLLLRRSSRFGLHRRGWTKLIGLNLFAHLLLDSCNAYGTELLWPVVGARISINTLYVADPLFTLVPLLVFSYLAWRRSVPRRAQVRAARRALSCCAVYLLLAAGAKWAIEEKLEEGLGGRPGRFFTTPAPYSILLWYAVAEEGDGFRTAYYSLFDPVRSIRWEGVPRQAHLLAGDSTVLRRLTRFSQGFYAVSGSGEGLTFSDLRFGRIRGWAKENAPFVFQYYLRQPPVANATVMQRGRVSGWTGAAWRTLWQRMWGRHIN